MSGRARSWVLLAVLYGSLARGDQRGKGPMAEPLIGETITDIDGDEAGEGEVDGTAWGNTRLRAPAFGLGELELEIKLTRRIGIAVAVEASGDPSSAFQAVGVRVGAALGLLHDWRHDLHLQLEATARAFEAERSDGDRVESDAPYRVGLRAGYRHVWLTLRAGAGLSFGGERLAPVWLDLAILGEWGRPRGRSFAGVEMVSDFSLRIPVVVIPEIAIGFAARRFPLRVGAGVPIGVGYRARDCSFGGLLRLILEVEPG
jgi:hypothetical protein